MQMWSHNLATGRAPPAVWRYPLNHARVLLADDHLAILNRVSALLSATFEVVGAVANGRELVSAGIRLDPDVIVTDITMPKLSGIEAAINSGKRDPEPSLSF